MLVTVRDQEGNATPIQISVDAAFGQIYSIFADVHNLVDGGGAWLFHDGTPMSYRHTTIRAALADMGMAGHRTLALFVFNNTTGG